MNDDLHWRTWLMAAAFAFIVWIIVNPHRGERPPLSCRDYGPMIGLVC